MDEDTEYQGEKFFVLLVCLFLLNISGKTQERPQDSTCSGQCFRLRLQSLVCTGGFLPPFDNSEVHRLKRWALGCLWKGTRQPMPSLY